MSGTAKGTAGIKPTLIEEGTEIKGNIASSCPIVVMGKIEGDISGPSMEVAESGMVSGRIKVTELRCRGEMSGQFEAERVELSGRVRDQTLIRAGSLEVLGIEGSHPVLFGECELSIGEEPDKQQAIDEATGLTAPTASRPSLPPAMVAASLEVSALPPPPTAASASEDPATSERRHKRTTSAVHPLSDARPAKSPT